jgi:hypothetical protein
MKPRIPPRHLRESIRKLQESSNDLTAEEIYDNFKVGALDEDDAIGLLLDLGYDGEDAQTFLGSGDLGGGEPHDEASGFELLEAGIDFDADGSPIEEDEDYIEDLEGWILKPLSGIHENLADEFVRLREKTMSEYSDEEWDDLTEAQQDKIRKESKKPKGDNSNTGPGHNKIQEGGPRVTLNQETKDAFVHGILLIKDPEKRREVMSEIQKEVYDANVKEFLKANPEANQATAEANENVKQAESDKAEGI